MPTEYRGVRYDSRLEASCAQSLDRLVLNGDVLWWTRQVPFVLEGGVVYRADFVAALSEGPPYVRVIDATGVLLQSKKNKLKQMRARYGIIVDLYRESGGMQPWTAL